MKKVLLLILFSMIVVGIRAQGYTPKVGDTIMFYPLTEKAKQEYQGYDCFYDATKVFPKNIKMTNYDYYEFSRVKQTSYKFKDGFQYNCNKNGLTPFDEIEGKTFKVLKTEAYMHKGKQENKVFLLFLSRIEDEAKIVLRVPFFEKNASFLTKNMIAEKLEGYTYKTKYLYVNLPCIPANYMNSISDKFKGQELYFKWQNKRSDYDYDDYKLKEKNLEDIFKSVNNYTFDESSFGICLDVKFIGCDLSPYCHPFVTCKYKNINSKETVINIPLTYIAGNTPFFNLKETSNCLFEYFFTIKKDELRAMLADEDNLWVIETFSGKKVYYGANGMFDYDNEDFAKYVTLKIRSLSDNTIYKLKEGVYNCLSFDIYKDLQTNSDVFAILEDSLGIKFRVPVTSPVSNRLNRDRLKKHRLSFSFQDCFMLVDEAYALKEKQTQLAIQKEKEEKERYASWIKKYGATYAEFINGLTTMQKEKFERLVPKYGKATAKMMVEGKVRIGWSKQMCRESWGEPDDINRTTGSWGTHEQWVYGEYDCDYLYFENGVLTSIQN